jgi:hypothetical protein
MGITKRREILQRCDCSNVFILMQSATAGFIGLVYLFQFDENPPVEPKPLVAVPFITLSNPLVAVTERGLGSPLALLNDVALPARDNVERPWTV